VSETWVVSLVAGLQKGHVPHVKAGKRSAKANAQMPKRLQNVLRRLFQHVSSASVTLVASLKVAMATINAYSVKAGKVNANGSARMHERRQSALKRLEVP
jgi:hypothetical protein